MSRIKVLFVASEMAPIAKVGGLADVIYSLPKALLKIGIDAKVIIPKYEQINDKKIKFLKNFYIKADGKDEKISLYKTKIDTIEIFLVENKKYLSQGDIYFSRTAFATHLKEIKRFLFFSKSVFEVLKELRPNIIHLNDWHTGALTSFVKKKHFPLKIVFTIHNLANQGVWNRKAAENFLGFKNIFSSRGKNVNLMAEGIINSDIITTVSPSYAKEILTKKYGEKLEKIILKRKNDLFGILNGVDYDFFNPKIDRFIAKKYSPANLALKEKNKIALQKECALNRGGDNIVFGLVSRLTKQKGIDLLLKVCENFVKKYNFEFVFLGQGENKYEKALLKLNKKYPGKIFVKIGFDEKFAHRIYSGSDFFLMPSRFEPCGLGQMIALKYGTIPIAFKTGGFKDTIKNGKNGFVFSKFNAAAFQNAIFKAMKLFENKKSFEAMKKTHCQ